MFDNGVLNQSKFQSQIKMSKILLRFNASEKNRNVDTVY